MVNKNLTPAQQKHKADIILGAIDKGLRVEGVHGPMPALIASGNHSRSKHRLSPAEGGLILWELFDTFDENKPDRNGEEWRLTAQRKFSREIIANYVQKYEYIIY